MALARRVEEADLKNRAAWLRKRGGPLRVGAAAQPTPGPGDIVVRNAAVALNPIDVAARALGSLLLSWTRLPLILGSDVAGEVVAVGSGVTRFALGDRVLGLADGLDEDRRDPAGAAFQRYTVLRAALSCPIPDGMAYTQACVLPLGLATAASALFQADHLGLRLPRPHPTHEDGVLLVWGGSTSVGCNAIQLGVAAGYRVFAFASRRNHPLLTSLGAERAFDYHDKAVVAEAARALEGSITVGALAIGEGSGDRCLAILRQAQGPRRLVEVTPNLPVGKAPAGPAVWPWLVAKGLRMAAANAMTAGRARRAGVLTSFVWGSSLKHNAVGPAIFSDYLPTALRAGAFAPAPQAQVQGEGLKAIDASLDVLALGVSARKLVVSLEPASSLTS